MGIVPINSKDEFQKVLAIYKLTSVAALTEIATFMGGTPEEFTTGAAKVLEKYARYATLTEFQQMPHLADSEKWGATFGVATLTSSLILEQARKLLRVQGDLRFEFMEFLTKLQAKGSGKIEMDALTRIFAVLSEGYGLVWVEGDKLALTVVGSRVLLHMLDASKFIAEVALASAKFQ